MLKIALSFLPTYRIKTWNLKNLPRSLLRIKKILSNLKTLFYLKRKKKTLILFIDILQCNELSSKLKTDLSMEYSQIPKQKINSSYNVANLEENKIFNNNQLYIPYDDNRVRLTPSMDNRLGYINTSYITVCYPCPIFMIFTFKLQYFRQLSATYRNFT